MQQFGVILARELYLIYHDVMSEILVNENFTLLRVKLVGCALTDDEQCAKYLKRICNTQRGSIQNLQTNFHSPNELNKNNNNNPYWIRNFRIFLISFYA